MKTSKIFLSTTCPICGKAPSAPVRVFDGGKVVQGCVDHFHTGHLVTPSESSFWHNRPEAKKIRAAIKAGRDGCVTEFAAA